MLGFGIRRASALGLVALVAGVAGAVSIASAASPHHRRHATAHKLRHTGASRSKVALHVFPRGQHLSVHIDAPARARCALNVLEKRTATGFSQIQIGRTGQTLIRWSVPTSAPSGRWQFSVSCTVDRKVQTADANIILVNHGSGNGSLIRHGSVKILGAAADTAQATIESPGQAVVNEAAKWAGTQYCWDGGSTAGPTRGTEDPTDGDYLCRAGTTGFDCTGLTLYAIYQVFGITLAHDPEQGATTAGQVIGAGSLQPGDVVYFGKSIADAAHAGIYAGNGEFWSAVTEGLGVKEETMKWEEAEYPFAGALRFTAHATTTPTAPAPAPTAPAPLGPNQYHVMNAPGLIGFRTSPDWNASASTSGSGFDNDTVISVSCYENGAGDVPGSTDSMWEQASWVSGDGGGSGWIDEHFIEDGSALGQPSPGVPACATTPTGTTTTATTPTGTSPTGTTPTGTGTTSSPTPPTTTSAPPAEAPTWNETVGSVAHTWTDYADGGGTEGPSIADGQTVAIACKLSGLKVADGNTWWYRIASSPWNSAYYVSADAFYNDGATSGSLVGTPFVDSAVANC